ncbi:hypothetical protein ACOME3_008779 [Neoechinorhynchus agilis]
MDEQTYNRMVSENKFGKGSTWILLVLFGDNYPWFRLMHSVNGDNGPPFQSTEFQRFCAANGIKHIRTSSYQPQTNGRAWTSYDVNIDGDIFRRHATDLREPEDSDDATKDFKKDPELDLRTEPESNEQEAIAPEASSHLPTVIPRRGYRERRPYQRRDPPKGGFGPRGHCCLLHEATGNVDRFPCPLSTFPCFAPIGDPLMDQPVWDAELLVMVPGTLCAFSWEDDVFVSPTWLANELPDEIARTVNRQNIEQKPAVGIESGKETTFFAGSIRQGMGRLTTEEPEESFLSASLA